MGEVVYLHGAEPQSLNAWREQKEAVRLKQPAIFEFAKAQLHLVSFVDPDDRGALLDAVAKFDKALRALNAEIGETTYGV